MLSDKEVHLCLCATVQSYYFSSVAYIGLWGPCDDEGCSDPNAICWMGQCQCVSGYYEDQGRCGECTMQYQ